MVPTLFYTGFCTLRFLTEAVAVSSPNVLPFHAVVLLLWSAVQGAITVPLYHVPRISSVALLCVNVQMILWLQYVTAFAHAHAAGLLAVLCGTLNSALMCCIVHGCATSASGLRHATWNRRRIHPRRCEQPLQLHRSDARWTVMTVGRRRSLYHNCSCC